MRASCGPFGRRYSRAISFSFLIQNVTAGYRCRALLAFLPFLPVMIVRSLSRQGIVETLIENTDEANLTLFTRGLVAGQSVRILRGPFADFVGTLERLDEAGRVRVLLDMMGTAVPVALGRSAICPAA